MQLELFGQHVPLMLLTYVGSLKTWVYSAVFAVWKPSVASLRIPVLLLAGATVYLSGLLLRRIAGTAAAICISALLATDTVFLLTTMFDWGPVAFQRLLAVAAMLLLLRFHQNGSSGALFGAFVCLGLGLWDKAVFSWMLIGIVIAAVVVFPREIRNSWSWRNLRIAILGGVLGALPLIMYNVTHDFSTFRSNAKFSADNIAGKAAVLRATLDGSGLFGYMVNEHWVDPVRNPEPGMEQFLVGLQERLGAKRTNLIPWALALSLAAVPFWWRRRRAMVFPVVAAALAWLQMAFTKDAGGSVHHATLLWPLPLWIIAVALAGIATGARWRKWVTAALLTVLCLTNLRVTNQYYTQFVRNGAGPVWSDANTRLVTQTLPNADILVMDWGMLYSLRTFQHGQRRIWNGVDAVLDPDITAEDRASILHMLSIPGAIFIAHTPRFEVHKGAAERLTREASALGYTRQVFQTVWDSNDRPVFELYRYVRTTAGR